MTKVTIDATKLDFSKPITNLLFNMMSGLKYENLTETEKTLLKEHGYKKEKKNDKSSHT